MGTKLLRSVAIIFIAFVLLSVVYFVVAVDHITITVDSKERITDKDGKKVKSKYMIFTENEVFENTDAPMLFKFNSSDLYNNLKIDSTYQVKVYGFRIPFISQYRNIIKIEE